MKKEKLVYQGISNATAVKFDVFLEENSNLSRTCQLFATQLFN